MCCHVGGDIDFDAAGNLYLSTGDDTNPFDSGGYTPIDERADRNPAFDAQRTSGNSNDLRGKVLRIRPGAAGGYTIPAGNMFAPGHGQHQARGVRHGLPQPVPDERGQGDRRRLPRRLRARRRHRRPAAAGRRAPSRSSGSPSRASTAGRTAPTTTRPTSTSRSPVGPSGAAVQLRRRADRTTRATTPASPQLPPSQAAWLPYGGGQDPPACAGGGLSPMGGPVYNYNPRWPPT